MEKITKLPLLDETGKKIVQELNDLKAYTAAYMDGSDGMFISFIMDGPPEELSNNNIKNVRSYAFYNRFNLTAIDLPNAISVGNGAFWNCKSLTLINLPKVISIGDTAFRGCPATIMNLQSVTTIGDSAFYKCPNLVIVDFLPNAISISYCAFENCSALTTVDLPNAEKINGRVFANCSALTTVNLPKVTSIGFETFENCSALTTVNLPKVTSIGWHAFKNCSSLTTIYISNLMEISNAAFDRCSNLTSIILRNTEQVCTVKKTYSWDDTGIYNGTGYIYVPDELVEQYKTATYWSDCSDKIKPLSEYVESEAQL